MIGNIEFLSAYKSNDVASQYKNADERDTKMKSLSNINKNSRDNSNLKHENRKSCIFKDLKMSNSKDPESISKMSHVHTTNLPRKSWLHTDKLKNCDSKLHTSASKKLLRFKDEEKMTQLDRFMLVQLFHNLQHPDYWPSKQNQQYNKRTNPPPFRTDINYDNLIYPMTSTPKLPQKKILTHSEVEIKTKRAMPDTVPSPLPSPKLTTKVMSTQTRQIIPTYLEHRPTQRFALLRRLMCISGESDDRRSVKKTKSKRWLGRKSK